MVRPPPIATLFPYTTLFRSRRRDGAQQKDLRAGRSPRPLLQQPCAAAHRSADGAGGSCGSARASRRSEEHTSELQSRFDLVCRLLLEEKKQHRVAMARTLEL